MRLLYITITIAIWGLLVWGNLSLINWSNTEHNTRMANNYKINNYEGKLLLSQDEYSGLKQYLLDPEIVIHNFDVYGSPDVLVIYDFSSPDSKPMPFVAEPQSQHWKHPTDRFGDYLAFAIVGIISLAIGIFLSLIFSIPYFRKEELR